MNPLNDPGLGARTRTPRLAGALREAVQQDATRKREMMESTPLDDARGTKVRGAPRRFSVPGLIRALVAAYP